MLLGNLVVFFFLDILLLISLISVSGYKPRQPAPGNSKSWFVYVLQLVKGKYYVGKSCSPVDRIIDHAIGGGSTWTKRYPPVKVLNIYPNCDNFDEQKYTLKMMKSKGIENVRGGPFCTAELLPNEVETIKKMLNDVSNACYVCGKSDHFASGCPSRCGKCGNYSKYGYVCKACAIPRTSVYSNRQMTSRKSSPSPPPPTNVCFRCGREGHFVSDCYASFHVKGYPLNDESRFY